VTFDTDDPDWNEIMSLIREASAKSRGYAEYWEWRIDRPLTEQHAAHVLANFLTRKGELTRGTVALFRPDPPDVLLTREDGSRIGIEVTELVDGKMAAHHRHLKTQGLPISYGWAPWTPASIAAELSRIVAVKDSKLKKATGNFSKLLLAIVTDEPAIDEVVGRQGVILSGAIAELIDRAFLILSYDPQADEGRFPNRCPVLEIPLHRPL
jgi:hypothetical protein